MFGIHEVPVNDLPCIGQVSNYLHGNENFLFDIDGADHLVKELSGVRQELTDLQVRLQLVELLDLKARRNTSLQMDINIQITIKAAATPNCMERWSTPAWQSYYFFTAFM